MADRPEGYARHVDGLRALAILAVVGFHTGLPGFGGGFVGVDVFFVISGYLIIGQIAGQLRAGRFSFAEFFARRALRLLPLLLTVILAASAAAAVVLATPAEYTEFGQSAVAAAAMVSNHFFWATQGYFDTAAETKPLLHTWSLGVEAQFYLAAPVLIASLWTLSAVRRRWLLWTAGLLLAALSLAACWHWTSVEHNAAFFLMPFRAWEFLAGAAVLALQARRRGLPPALVDALAVVGALLIAASAAFYSAGTAYPSWRPLVPVGGAALLLFATGIQPGRWPHRLLSLPPLVGIGLVSYGWYLWHWPLLALWRISSFGRSGILSDVLVGGVGGLLLAVLTYFVIERPVARAKGALAQRLRGASALAVVAAAVVAALPGLYLWKLQAPAVEARLTRADLPTKTALDPQADPCIFSNHTQLSDRCTVDSAAPRGLLVGDSHARESYPVLAAAAGRAGVQLVTMPMPGCPPLFGLDVLFAGQPQGCTTIWRQDLETLDARHARFDFAIVQATWSIYLGAENGHRPPRLLVLPGQAVAEPDQYAALRDGLLQTVSALRRMGVRRVLLVAPAPQYMLTIPECILRAKAMGLSSDTCSRPLAEVEPQRLRTLSALREVARRQSGVRVIDPFEVLCDATACRPHLDGMPLYVDDNHLSQAGIARLFRHYRQDLQWVLGAPPAPPD